jgi:hyperosmotically inducible periplasmic protein
LMTGCNLDAEDGPASTDREAERPVTVATPSDPALIPGEAARIARTGSDDEVVNSDDQSDAPEDIAMTRSIREAVVADDSLSPEAKNVVIVTRDARVTLRGDAMTVAERATIARLAAAAPGVRDVDNLIVAR